MAISTYDDAPDQADFAGVKEYRSVSVLAVVSLMLGIASVLALVQIILVGIPIAGLAVSCLALARARDTAASGRALAVIGLILSTFLGAFALTRYTADQSILCDLAERVAGKWIDLVQSRQLRLAHQWSISQSLRMGRAELLDSYYENNPASEQSMKKLFQKDGLRELAELGTRGMVRLVASREIHQDRREQVFELDYVLTSDDKETPFQLVVVRRWDLDYLRHDWLINAPEKQTP